ncbi:MAG: cysteine hydrolase [Candidatus Omnitrophica bacterium]|nr:cysteine hydrolase [Candidatus Omnitrophota bacterium]
MKVLLIIDMLKDFMEEGGSLYCGEESEKIIPFIKQKIDEYHASGDKVIYICDAHDADDKEFKTFAAHAVKGSNGGEVIDELIPQEDDIIIEKQTLEPFYKTDLDGILKELAPDVVEVTGVCTSICIIETVGGLNARGYKTLVHKDGVADFDAEAHNFALKHMERVYGAEII